MNIHQPATHAKVGSKSKIAGIGRSQTLLVNEALETFLAMSKKIKFSLFFILNREKTFSTQLNLILIWTSWASCYFTNKYFFTRLPTEAEPRLYVGIGTK